MFSHSFHFTPTANSSDKKGEGELIESVVEPVEGDVQGNVQIKMVVSNGRVRIFAYLITSSY